MLQVVRQHTAFALGNGSELLSPGHITDGVHVFITGPVVFIDFNALLLVVVYAGFFQVQIDIDHPPGGIEHAGRFETDNVIILWPLSLYGESPRGSMDPHRFVAHNQANPLLIGAFAELGHQRRIEVG